MEGYLVAEKPTALVSMDLEGGGRGKCPIQAREGSYPWKGLGLANKGGMSRVDRVRAAAAFRTASHWPCPWAGNVSADFLVKAEPEG